MPYLIVKSRDKTLFEGTAENITSYNKVGIFNILLDHSNFITIIEKKIIFNDRGTTKEIIVDNGLVKVRNNKIYVYIGVK
ncbi:hypothetical protein BH10PAT1_BH10PAT1_1880 [soil metagenome]